MYAIYFLIIYRLKKPEADIMPLERERTKRLVYASLYGAGTRKLMEILDVDYQHALQITASFNSKCCYVLRQDYTSAFFLFLLY